MIVVEHLYDQPQNLGALTHSIPKMPAHSKNEILYYLAPAQRNCMQPILVSCEAPFRSNLQKKNTGPVGVMTLTGPVVQ